MLPSLIPWPATDLSPYKDMGCDVGFYKLKNVNNE